MYQNKFHNFSEVEKPFLIGTELQYLQNKMNKFCHIKKKKRKKKSQCCAQPSSGRFLTAKIVINTETHKWPMS